ncbi:hypothetical protein LMH87_004456 [Akanthomyces muscarius]|uniref:Uncharacterized protein n=1 Tax=Akanthomyces muscarius TaxID=2231603 RepID=A0A9W8Q3S4_AKAMU|nr:hypothetical protein LMH87_004456 [Akanthomyces muscarius]KAJ4145610.1 hypothetical protein LMH87_004456 [Akanthomyces muscarius]
MIHSFSDRWSTMDIDLWLSFITLEEAAQIWTRFHDACEPNNLLLRRGVGFDQVESWAKEHDRRTLTQAMGPLKDKSDPSCRYRVKSAKQWTRYVRAASILFALYISTGREVVVLTPHPPQRLNPNHTSYCQNIEEPRLTSYCDENEFKIIFAHPRTKAVKDYIYQYWPLDCVAEWTAQFPGARKAQRWENHVWDDVKRLEHQPGELQQRRKSILENLYLHRTGASVSWPVAAPANDTRTIYVKENTCTNAEQGSLPTAAAGQTATAETRPKKLTKSEKKEGPNGNKSRAFWKSRSAKRQGRKEAQQRKEERKGTEWQKKAKDSTKAEGKKEATRKRMAEEKQKAEEKKREAKERYRELRNKAVKMWEAEQRRKAERAARETKRLKLEEKAKITKPNARAKTKAKVVNTTEET